MKDVMKPVFNRFRARKQPEIFEFAVLFDSDELGTRCLGKIEIIGAGDLLVNMAARDRVIELLLRSDVRTEDILPPANGVFTDIMLSDGSKIRIVPLPQFDDYATVVADHLLKVRERALPRNSAA